MVQRRGTGLFRGGCGVGRGCAGAQEDFPQAADGRPHHEAQSPGRAQEAEAPGALLVACLCAAWCRTCESYRATFDALAAEFKLHELAIEDCRNMRQRAKLEQYDVLGATALAVVMLAISFVLLLVINALQWWAANRHKNSEPLEVAAGKAKLKAEAGAALRAAA